MACFFVTGKCMLTPKVTIPLIFLAGFLTLLVCAPAFGGSVADVSVDVRNHEGRHVGEHLVDGDTATAWVGGGSGIGPGKWIEFFFPAGVLLQSLKVANGHQGKGRFSQFRRISRGVILYPDETRQKFTLKSQEGLQTIRLEPKTVTSFKIIITGVDPGPRDTSMGKAKVAVSEMTIYGEMIGTPDDAEESGEETDSATADDGRTVEREPEPVRKPEPAKKPAAEPHGGKSVAEPVSPPKSKKAKPVAQVKPVVPEKETPVAAKEAKPVKKIEPKPQPEATSEKTNSKKVVKKAPPKSEVKKTPAPKKKKAAPAKANKSASGAVTRFRTVKEISESKPLDTGVINPWVDLEVVARIKRYFALLTNLGDSYPDMFSISVRERERKAFMELQQQMRAEKEFGKHHIAMLEHIGLNFDKPEESNDAMSLRVHGPYRYYTGNQTFEFMVDAQFYLVRENGQWLISDIRDN